MPAQRSRLVRVMPEEEIHRITGTLPYATSLSRNWTGIEVHRYSLPATSDTKEFKLPQLAIFLPHDKRPKKVRLTVGEDSEDTFMKDVSNDVVTIAPAALTRRASIDQPHELTAIFLDPLVFSEIAHGETGLHYPEIMPQFAIVDPVIRSIGLILDHEMRSTNPKPASYVERLAVTLASHIFVTYSAPVYREMRSLGANWTKLRRCIAHMHANIDKALSLDHLAMVARMSSS